MWFVGALIASWFVLSKGVYDAANRFSETLVVYDVFDADYLCGMHRDCERADRGSVSLQEWKIQSRWAGGRELSQIAALSGGLMRYRLHP